MRIQFIKKNLEKDFPKETLNVLGLFSVLNFQQYPTDVHSQELLYMGMMKLSGKIRFQIGCEGMRKWNEIPFEMTQLLKKWFLKSQIEANKINVNLTSTE